MRVNYYAISPLQKVKDENVTKFVKYKDYNTEKQIIEKYSHGWNFLFDTKNEKYYELNKESNNNFINFISILQDESS